MTITERLRALQDAFLKANTDDDVRRTGREFGAEMVAKSDYLLAVVDRVIRYQQLVATGKSRTTKNAARAGLFAALDELERGE